MIKKLLSFAFLFLVLITAFELGHQAFWKILNHQQGQIETQLCTLGMDVFTVVFLLIFTIIFNNSAFLDGYFYLGPLYRVLRIYFIVQQMKQGSKKPKPQDLDQNGMPNPRQKDEEIDSEFTQIIVIVLVSFWCLYQFLVAFKNWSGFPNQDFRTTQREKKLYFSFFHLLQKILLAALNFVLVSSCTFILISYIMNQQENEGILYFEHQGLVLIILSILLRGIQYAIKQQQKNQQFDGHIQRWSSTSIIDAIFWFGVYLACSRNARIIHSQEIYSLTYGLNTIIFEINNFNIGVYAFGVSKLLNIIGIV